MSVCVYNIKNVTWAAVTKVCSDCDKNLHRHKEKHITYDVRTCQTRICAALNAACD